MTQESLGFIFINACFINNFVLAYFLGICPFLGVSGKIGTAWRMGLAVTFVMIISSTCAYGIHALLVSIDAPYLQLISYIVVIASAVQTVEMFIKKVSPTLFRQLGIFLPLITTNCAILGLCLELHLKGVDSLLTAAVLSIGAGVGFTMAICIMAGIRENLDLADVPECLKGAPITLITAGIMTLAFMGFSGMIK